MKLVLLCLAVLYSGLSFADVACEPADVNNVSTGLKKNHDEKTDALVASATACNKRTMGQLILFKFKTSEGVVSLSYDAVAHVVTNVKLEK